METKMSLDERINAFMAVSFQYLCGSGREAEALRFDLQNVLEWKADKEKFSQGPLNTN